jgi:hypothetical protein
MKKILFYTTTYLLLIGLLIVSLVGWSVYFNKRERETFIPAIQKMYQPHVRNARLIANQITDKVGKNISLFSKKNGLT